MHRYSRNTKNAITATSAKCTIFSCLLCKRDSLVEKNTKSASKVQTAELSERQLTCATARREYQCYSKEKEKDERAKAPDGSLERASASDHEAHNKIAEEEEGYPRKVPGSI